VVVHRHLVAVLADAWREPAITAPKAQKLVDAVLGPSTGWRMGDGDAGR
jgi:hypothetical protein